MKHFRSLNFRICVCFDYNNFRTTFIQKPTKFWQSLILSCTNLDANNETWHKKRNTRSKECKGVSKAAKIYILPSSSADFFFISVGAFLCYESFCWADACALLHVLDFFCGQRRALFSLGVSDRRCFGPKNIYAERYNGKWCRPRAPVYFVDLETNDDDHPQHGTKETGCRVSAVSQQVSVSDAWMHHKISQGRIHGIEKLFLGRRSKRRKNEFTANVNSFFQKKPCF